VERGGGREERSERREEGSEQERYRDERGAGGERLSCVLLAPLPLLFHHLPLPPPRPAPYREAEICKRLAARRLDITQAHVREGYDAHRRGDLRTL